MTRIIRSIDKLLQNRSDIFIESDINSFVRNQLVSYQADLEENYSQSPLKLTKGINHDNYSARILLAEMSLVLANILHNAMYALREKSSKDPLFAPELMGETQCDAKYVSIRIQGNDPGISEEEKKQLFSPFFITKPTFKGTGLGLFLSQDIVKTHKGSIAVDTQPDAYTAFTIILPLSIPYA